MKRTSLVPVIGVIALAALVTAFSYVGCGGKSSSSSGSSGGAAAPVYARFAYAANYEDNTISGYTVDAATGQL